MTGSDSLSAVAAGEDHRILTLDSSPAATTDPLLHPPPSPTSTASSPTATADHDALIEEEEDGEDDDSEPEPAPAPAPHVPAASDEATPEFAQITVSDPRKHAPEAATGAAGVIPGSGSYFSYLITARAADGELIRVRRRFRDVVALADRLAATHRGLFVPARPDKSVVEGQVMQRRDFVNQRCVALQRYLGRLATHPTIGRSGDLHAFLTELSGIPTYEGESPRSDPGLSAAMSAAVTPPTPPAKPGRDFLGMLKDLKQTVANGWVAARPPPVEEETDAKFLAHKAKLEYFEQHLTTTSQQVKALLKAYDDLKVTTGHLGMTFIKLAKFEKEQDTCNSQRKRAADMSNFANAVIRVSRSQTKLNAETEKHLGTVYEYMEIMTSIHNAFTDRANALLHVQNMSADLYPLHTEAAKLESVSSRGFDQERLRYQKIEELKEKIRATEGAKSDARREYELIKENNMNEIRRFNKQKRHGLMEMLKGFVRNQVSYSDQISSIWTKVAEETKGYTDRSS